MKKRLILHVQFSLFESDKSCDMYLFSPGKICPKLMVLVFCTTMLSGCLTLNNPIRGRAVFIGISTGSSGGGTVTCASLGSATTYNAGGSGTSGDPYLICTAAQFIDIGNNTAAWDKHFQLGANIDLTGYTRVSVPGTIPIGSSTTPFTGTFDGQGYTVSNFDYDGDAISQDNVGVFGVVRGYNTWIRRLGVVNVSVIGRNRVGGLAARLERGASILNCYSTGTVRGGISVGGLVGMSGGSTAAIGNFPDLSRYTGAVISSSYSTASVNDAPSHTGQYHGGLVGEIHEGSVVVNNWASGNVSSTQCCTGGFAGEISAAYVARNYSGNSTISGIDQIGGFVGLITDAYVIDNFSAANSVTGNDAASGIGVFRGIFTSGTVTNAYRYEPGASPGTNCTNGHASGCNAVGTNVDNLADFYNQAHAVYTGGEPWDFTDVWVAGASFPTLSPQFLNETTWGTCATHLADAPFAGGNGTPENPWLICTAAQLEAIDASASRRAGKFFKVMQNIDISTMTPTALPLGHNKVHTTDPTNIIAGQLDGNNYTLSNFTFDNNVDRDAGNPGNDTIQNAGLFTRGEDFIVKNLTLSNVNVQASHYSAALGGVCEYCLIANVTISGTVSSTDGGQAGLLYRTTKGLVMDSNSSVNVTSTTGAGGLVDFNEAYLINCSASGNVTSTGTSDAGGLVGSTSIDTVITGSRYTGGTVTCSNNATWGCGGLIGYHSGTVRSSYSSGNVVASGVGEAGGLIGTNDTGTVEDCYSTATVTPAGANDTGGLIGTIVNGGTITRSYFSGLINAGTGNIGGLVGSMAAGTLSHSFYAGQLTMAGGTRDWTVGNSGGGVLTNLNYFDDATACTSGCNDIAGGSSTGRTPVTYFWNSANEPYATGTWSTTTWSFSGTALPTLP